MTQDIVMELIAREAKCRVNELSMDSKLNDLGIDSLKAIVLLSELEDQFKIEIPNETMGTLHTVGDIIAKIDELRQTKQSA